MSDNKARLFEFRQVLKNMDIDAFIITHNDIWNNEHPNEQDQRFKYMCELNSSAGYIVITPDKACVLIDGRYTVLAKNTIDTNLFNIEYYTEISPHDWAIQNLSQGQIIGFDPWLHSKNNVETMQNSCDNADIKLQAIEQNPVDVIWKNKPAKTSQKAINHGIKFSGKTTNEKLDDACKIIENNNVNCCIITAPDSIAWMLNLRELSNPQSPGINGFAIIEIDTKKVNIFTDVDCSDFDYDQSNNYKISFNKKDDFSFYIKKLNKSAQLSNDAPIYISNLINTVIKPDPFELLKSIKNETEQEGIRSSQKRDAIAIKSTIKWIKESSNITEIDVANKLIEERSKNNLFRGTSFDSIVGWNENGAAIHGTPTDTKIKGNGFLLIDSGGQYDDGTTDITRTISIGTPTDEMKEKYTLVLKAHIALATAIFPIGTTGVQIDALVRAPLWKAEIDFAHGTGHGVGHFLNVHEGPVSISPKSIEILQAGMFLSNEPGYYKEGHFGIRHENLVIVQEYMSANDQKNENGKQLLCFKTVTHVPFEDDCVIRPMMTDEEIKWFDNYQKLSR